MVEKDREEETRVSRPYDPFGVSGDLIEQDERNKSLPLTPDPSDSLTESVASGPNTT